MHLINLLAMVPAVAAVDTLGESLSSDGTTTSQHPACIDIDREQSISATPNTKAQR